MPWPEDVPPDQAIPCDMCELSKQSSRLIWGEGNPLASVWILLDNPGSREQERGTPFVCGTRQTLHSTLKKIGFSEADLLYADGRVGCTTNSANLRVVWLTFRGN